MEIEGALRQAAHAAQARGVPELAESAARAGLIDVAYAEFDSPVGKLLLAATERGLVRLAYVDNEPSRELTLAELSRRVSPRILSLPRRLDEPRRELEEYFAGRRRGFELPLDWQLAAGFARRVLRATAGIPYGEVRSYGEIAAAAGSPRGFRAAGNALGTNPLPIVVPCHRVIHAGGGLGGYTGGIGRKSILLAVERRPG
ncbi:MAG: methylated-DNA--[protein]-cysteine S-methyltransferase [Solirubrobacteraceae bacterium]